MRLMNASVVASLCMAVTENRAHGYRNTRPLTALRLGPPAAFCRQAVVFPLAAGRTLAPGSLQQAGALHLVESGVHGPLLQLEGLRAPPLRLHQDFVAVHFPF